MGRGDPADRVLLPHCRPGLLGGARQGLRGGGPSFPSPPRPETPAGRAFTRRASARLPLPLLPSGRPKPGPRGFDAVRTRSGMGVQGRGRGLAGGGRQSRREPAAPQRVFCVCTHTARGGLEEGAGGARGYPTWMEDSAKGRGREESPAGEGS